MLVLAWLLRPLPSPRHTHMHNTHAYHICWIGPPAAKPNIMTEPPSTGPSISLQTPTYCRPKQGGRQEPSTIILQTQTRRKTRAINQQHVRARLFQTTRLPKRNPPEVRPKRNPEYRAKCILNVSDCVPGVDTNSVDAAGLTGLTRQTPFPKAL